MTLQGEPRVWLEQFPLGEPAPFNQEHLGLVYPGEVVRVDRILQGQDDARLDDLLKIVRANDLSALSNTLDVELVEFIRRMIS